MSLRFEAIRFKQGSVKMYLAAIPARELVRRCHVDRYDPKRIGKWKGYQRKTFDYKVRSMRDYLLRGQVLLPVAGLLNVRRRGALNFRSRSSSNLAAGTATISDDEELYVVDMQHRLAGMEEAIERKQSVGAALFPVVIVEGLDRIEEAVQFYIVNTTAKKLGVDLARRLLIEHKRVREIRDVQPWEIKAVQIAMILERKPDTPWFGRVQEPNQDRTSDHICTEKGFVPTLRRFLKRPEYKNKGVDELARYLVSYWKAIAFVFPEAFQRPRRYVLQKVAPGVNVMHRLAPLIFDELKRRRRTISEGNIQALLKRLKPLGSRFWEGKNKRGAKRFGAGEEAFALLADFLRQKLRLRAVA